MTSSAGRAEPHVDQPAGDAPRRRRPKARRGEGDQLRAEIVAAASQLLAPTGDAGALSLRAVAREVGVATTSIYLHFATLDDLVLAVKTEYFAEFGSIMDDAAARAGAAPADRVRARARAYVGWGTTRPGRYRALFDAPMLPLELATQVARTGASVFEALRQEVEAATSGRDNGADLLAVHLWTALHGTVALRAARPHFDWPDVDAEIDSLVDRLLGTGAPVDADPDRHATPSKGTP